MRRWQRHVQKRLTARFCRIFARNIRNEAMRRKNGYQVGPFRRNNKALDGWFDVANWLDSRAVEYEEAANRAREPRF